MMDEEQGLREETGGGRGHSFLSEMIVVNFTYLIKTMFGRLKLLQLVFVTLCGVISPSVVAGLFSRYAFFVFIVWTAFMYIVCDIILHVTSLWRRLPILMTSPLVMMILLCMGAFSFLIGSSLLASAAHYAPNGAQAATSGLASFCGFIVMILFGAEVFFIFRSLTATTDNVAGEASTPEISSARSRPMAGPVTVDVVSTEPPPYKESDQSGGSGGAVYAPTTY